MSTELAIILALIGALATVVNVVFMLLNFANGRKKDVRTETVSYETRLNDINQSLIKANRTHRTTCKT